MPEAKAGEISVKVEKEVKPWYESKTIWLAVLTTLIGVSDFLYDTFTGTSLEWQDVFLIASGVAAVVIRVWFTDAEIAK